ncbi:MAG: Tyrosine-tRNA ligase [Parcubacteria group bacterium GW2011_GWF2_39_13b]|nr:MAG: Tyrosine-tRNA ligase [Parcubacteria group bacterium GW2011_GWF2_39_13b]
MKTNTGPQKIKELLERGVEEVILADRLENQLKSGKQLRIKFGIDPTGPAVHLGNAIPLWKLKQFQELGHQVVLLIGDFTARIGDTSDKQAIRQPLEEEEIQKNLKTYKEQMAKILDLEKTEFVYNSEWLKKMSFEDVLKLSSQFTVAQMIERENFSGRYKSGKPIGLQEFLYPLMQGYDSVAIKADVEIGGTDQTFNMLAGRVIQRAYGDEPQNVLTLSLIEGTDGRKMSKSYNNIIGIADSPKEMYGKIMSMRDELMVKYFNLCTQLPVEKIKAIENALATGKENPRNIKAELAKEITRIYHGEKAATSAEQEFNQIFRDKELPSNIPEFQISAGECNILDLLVKIKLAPSKAEAKRLIIQGGIKLNGQVEKNWQKTVEIEKIGNVIIQAGKRKVAKAVFKK